MASHRRLVVALTLLLPLVALPFRSLYSQQDSGRKVQPSSRATVDIGQIVRRELANPLAFAGQKKVENENENYPASQRVPLGIRGETYIIPPPSNMRDTSRSPLDKKLSGTGPEPNFPGLGDNGMSIPPDVGGAVGPNHVMTALNTQVRIQDKSGTNISTVTLNGFFSALGTFSVFDPKVFYDPFAARWFLTAPANSRLPTSALLIAVSATSDPTGTWTEYSFDADAGNLNWFDYPSIGFNNNWIVVTGNMFVTASGAFAGSQVYIFDKAALYAGTATPSVLLRPTGDGATMAPAITLDNSMNTEFLVSNWNGNSGGKGYLRLYTITGTAAAPVFTATTSYPNTTSTWADQPNTGAGDFAPQSTVANLIQNNESRMQGVVFQNGSLWVTHTVFLPVGTATHSAVDWWQINPATVTVQQLGRVEDATGTNFFAFPSIAVNAYNDVLVGYSSFSAAQFASSNYSFRLHSDPASTMQATVRFRAGLAKYFKTFSATKNRWGDYTSTMIDPDNFSLWTVQEYAENPVSGSDRWGTEWNRVVPPVPNLFVKDRPADVGAEPNPTTEPMWLSEDIWLRKVRDATHAFAHVHEAAEYRTGTANPNYLYVEVHNRGSAPSLGTEQVTLYWAKPSSGLSWPAPWTGGVYFDPGPNTMLMGGVIATVTIPVVASGASTILEFPWSPPDPAVYAGAFGADQNHFCILARIVSGGSPFGMTFPEVVGDLYGNVQKNNRIAWKNLEVFNLLPGTQAPVSAVVANLGLERKRLKVVFTGVDADGNARLLDKGRLTVRANPRMAKVLGQNRIEGVGSRRTGEATFQILRDGGYLRNIVLSPMDYASLQLVFVPTNTTQTRRGYAITVTQLEEVGGTERVMGGQTFVFGTVKGLNIGKSGVVKR